MNKIIVLGDIHANINHCVDLARRNPDKIILQLGDLGAGFVPTEFLQSILPSNFVFFVGNHDNREEARKLTHYLGDFGEYKGIFFVSGASSYDQNQRTIGVDWWPDEELSQSQAQVAIDLWEKSKCEIIVSHDCPSFISNYWWGIKESNHTRNMLQEMYRIRQPKLWVFGHWHRQKWEIVNGTKFVCLGIDKTFEI